MQPSDTFGLLQAEQTFLEKEKVRAPDLFVHTLKDSGPTPLERIGVSLPFSDLPSGYIKYSPLDFIVEEIDPDGVLHTVDTGALGPNALEPGGGRTLYADLVKVGISTIDAVKTLAHLLNVDDAQFGTAGIKDGYALTGQRVSIRSIRYDALKNLKTTNVFLKNVSSGKGVILTGQLKGNRFTLLIRTEKPLASDALASKIDALNKNGAWNFYWLQRFGNRLNFHWLGLLIFQGQYEECVRSYLCDEGYNELPYFAAVRKKAAERFGDPDSLIALFEPLPFTLRYELRMARYLKDNPGDYRGLLRAMPELTKFWVYAYTSYLFNQVLSRYANDSSRPAPLELPLALSVRREDMSPYRDFLIADGVPRDFHKHLRPFPYIRLQTRTVTTKIVPTVHAWKSIPEGLAIAFDLPKGCYATTLLAHLFTLVEGFPVPKWVKKTEVDTKEILGTGSIKDIHERFKNFIVPRESLVETGANVGENAET